MEILGVQWALDTDYNTAYYINERLLLHAYFRTIDGGFAFLSIEYELSDASGFCMCIKQANLNTLAEGIQVLD